MLIRKLAVISILVAVSSFIANGWPWVQDTVSKVRLTWSENPSTTMKIIWDTKSENGKDQVLFYDTVDHGDDFYAYRNKVKVQKLTLYKSMFNAVVHLRELTPNTKYYFIIRATDGKLSKRYWFKTIDDHEETRLSIIAGGDSRNNRTPRVAANKLVSKLRADFVLFGGDMTSLDLSGQWKKWFIDWDHTIAADGRITPVIVARGNHEARNESISKLFDTASGVYYSVSFANDLLKVFVLNSEISINGDQLVWLRDELSQSESSIWKFALYHRPMRPHTAKKSENDRIYQAWAPLFYEHGMNLVVESDSHTVKTTYPVRPSHEDGHDEGFVRDDERGTVYTGEGCWGAPLRDNNDDKSWTRSSGSFNQFKWIHLDRDSVEMRTIAVDNAFEVSSLSDDNRFAIPSNLKVWTPKEGAVVTLKSRN